ncbi:glycosyltransferase [Elizabethkingia argentiflava]|uniref:Glycosyltransferase n=1 Tax=Elizabethkingia argenteiflava TaxID=2681556 RepID=A0A845PVB5_9FLAO|nr:glycosyltransferase family A protein [Elizabethkingia argenteiflava]NAW51063.1 glycosyltransferase [Elizabethkingia argenteiflava]
MRFLIIIPCHNEEENILPCLDSLEKQSFQNFVCRIVNDGSTDSTQQKVENFIGTHSKFRLQNLPPSKHQPGAKVVHTFNQGLEAHSLEDFDVICKFDADIVFPSNYLQEVNQCYERNPKAGMVSGLVYIQKKGKWEFENLSSRRHVRGPIKSYRLSCFKDIGGLRPVLGWDNIDVMLAQMHTWQVLTLPALWVKHLRPTAYKYKNQKAQKLGQYFYNIGLNFPLALMASAKSSWRNKSLTEFMMSITTFLKQDSERKLSAEEISYIRALRWKKLFRRKNI